MPALTFRLFATVVLAMALSSGLHAQSPHYYRSGKYYRYRPPVPVVINPYYPHRPVYRNPYYYRLPYPYVHYGPAFGLRINVLPFGYSQFFIGPDPFYYSNGIYYQPYPKGGYKVAPPPLGAVVKSLPSGAKLSVIDGKKYYVLGGTFYQEKITSGNKRRYEVVGTDGVLNTTGVEKGEDNDGPEAIAKNIDQNGVSQEGSSLSQLPAGSKAVIISGQKYYLSPAGIYYQELIDANNIVSYQASGSPAVAGSQDNIDYNGD